MNLLAKLEKYQKLHRQAVDDYCSSSSPTFRTGRGLRRMIKYSKKIHKIKKRLDILNK